VSGWPGVLALLAALAWWQCASAQPIVDPIPRLREALKIGVLDRSDKEAVENRTQQIRAALERVQNTTDLRRALELTEWLDDPDQQLKQEVAERFLRRARAVVRSGDPRRQKALAILVGTIGTTIKRVDPPANPEE
jgi:hypothetical protein